MHSVAYEERYTVEDYRAWEGDWELVDGHAYAMAPSSMFAHQFISLKIARQLDEQLDSCATCHTLMEMDVNFSEDTVVRPDVMVICKVGDFTDDSFAFETSASTIDFDFGFIWPK